MSREAQVHHVIGYSERGQDDYEYQTFLFPSCNVRISAYHSTLTVNFSPPHMFLSQEKVALKFSSQLVTYSLGLEPNIALTVLQLCSCGCRGSTIVAYTRG